MRRAWQAAGVTVASLVVMAFAFAATGIVLSSDRLGALAALCGFTGCIGAFLWAGWTDIGKPHREFPSLSRADRKRLNDERSRIRVEAEIQRMEREAGL